MILRLNLFWKELVLFTLTLLIGIFAAHNYTPLIEKSIVEPPSFSWDSIVIALIFFSILFLALPKFKKLNSIFLRFFLLLVVFSGSQVVLGSVVNSPWDLLLALVAAAVFMIFRNVLIHDAAMVIGIAGISSILGITISPAIAVALLVILSFYDILAVYWTKHMVYMAKGMMESGAIFGFIIPSSLDNVFYHSHEAKKQIGDKFMILGSGDIGLPVIMASSIAVVSLSKALIVGFFAILGLLATHLIFVNQSERKPMAALPPIATMTIIGYLVSLIFTF